MVFKGDIISNILLNALQIYLSTYPIQYQILWIR